MTELAFHFNVSGKVDYACRLLRKAVDKGARVIVTAQPELLRELDVALWTFDALEFVPHCRAGAEPAMLAASAVVLAASLESPAHQQVLVNMGEEVPSGFERFERLIEVVGQDEEDRLSARRRWKHYADRGYAIVRHEIRSEAA
ncbi:MAG: DNA polymerase III subunit chi [Burkholderiaceae bacterium]|nr:DNA polymerase III subunit chi [Burkholderiaceae bacterium]